MKNRGFSLMEVIVATAIGGVILLTLASLMNVTTRTKSRLDKLEWLQQLRAEVFRTISTRRAWENTLAHSDNASLACVRNHTNCSGQGGELHIVTPNGTFSDRAANPLEPSAGFTRTGADCNNFDPAGSPGCPFRYAVRWDAVCDDVKCEGFQVKINARLIYAPGNLAALSELNTHPYDFTIIKDESTPAIEELCSKSGVFDSASNTCTVNADADCNFPFLLVGFTRDGRKMCAQFIPVRCPLDMVLTALDPNNHTVTCSPACEGGSPVTLPFGETVP